MLFSFHILGQTLLWTLITVVAVALFRFSVARKVAPLTLGVGAGIAFLLNLISFYCFMPAHVGSLHGYEFQLFVAFGVVILAQAEAMVRAQAQRNERRDWDYDDRRNRPSFGKRVVGFFKNPMVAVVTAAVFVLIVYPLAQLGVHTRFGSDPKDWAAQANIEVQPRDAKLPATDANHMVMVDRETAFNSAVRALGDWGRTYMVNKDDLTKESVNGHLVWVAPFEYNSDRAQFFDSMKGVAHTEGVVIVNAEDPRAPAEIESGLNIRYMLNGMFSQNLLRHVYAAGYTEGKLENPTLELDDNKRPFVTITYTRPKFLVGGDQAVEVLVVDMQTGEIKAYDPEHVPGWVDRVISEDMVDEYVGNWASFHNPGTGWWTGLFNGGRGQDKMDGKWMVYNTADSPVYIIGITSNTATNNSSTGIVLYDTRTRSGKFYPGIEGMQLDVANTFLHIQQNQNGKGNWDVAGIAPYNINGQTTWVALYTSPQNFGRSFAGIGLLESKSNSTADVQFGNDKATVLSNYQTWLATAGVNTGAVATSNQSKSVTGHVVKINWVNGKAYITLDSDRAHRFAVGLSATGASDIVELVSGEAVTFQYTDFGKREVEVTNVHYDPLQGRK